MKACFKCNRVLALSEFYVHPHMGDGHLGKCKDCAKKDAREHRAANIVRIAEYERQRFKTPGRKAKLIIYQRNRRARNPEKCVARRAIGNAIRDGKLKRLPCEICGEQKSQAHHDDYSKPFDVRWLCFKHHREAHGQKVLAR